MRPNGKEASMLSSSNRRAVPQMLGRTAVLLLAVAAGLSTATGETAGQKENADVVNIGTGKQVLWDGDLLESHEGVAFTMNPGTRTGERLLVADKPWEEWITGGY
jgi:hypothetical protein